MLPASKNQHNRRHGQKRYFTAAYLLHASVAKRQYILDGDRTVKAVKAKLTDRYSLDVLLNLREYAP